MDYEKFSGLVNSASALSLSANLLSAYGSADTEQLVTPPTFAGIDTFLLSPQRADGSHEHVVIDTRQSFANRLTQKMAELGLTSHIKVITPEGKILTQGHECPHGIFDAILRDSNLDGLPWRESPIGKSLIDHDNSAALYRYAPETLLFGGWDSHGGSGLGVKMRRIVAVEIFGCNARLMPYSSSKSDPLAISKSVGKMGYDANGQATLTEAAWVPALKDPKTGARTRLSGDPSELGHGQIVEKNPRPRGVWVEKIVLTGGIQLNELRKHPFGTPEACEAARVALVASSLAGIYGLLEDGLPLRSGCDLVASSAELKIVRSLAQAETLAMSSAIALELYEEAVERAGKAGLPRQTDQIVLIATPSLIKARDLSAGEG